MGPGRIGQAARFALSAGLLLAAAPAWAQFALLPGYPDVPMRGANAAKGAVIWSHGKARLADVSTGPIDPYAAILRDAGWDIYRLNRARVADREYDATRTLGEAVERLHGDGYSRVVLAGQSYGAWTSFGVAAKRDDVFAVVATAPAAYGTWETNLGSYDKNASFLYGMVEHVKAARVLIFLFADDDFDPGGRAPHLEALLRERQVVHRIVDRPPDLHGHGSAHTHLFTMRYGRCIADFLDPGREPSNDDCASDWGRRPTGEIPLPADARVEPPEPSAPAALAALSGRWWGWLGNGREVEVVISAVTTRGASMIYAVGPGADSGPAAVRRPVVVRGGGLVSAAPDNPTIILRPVPSGRAEVVWTAKDGQSSLRGTLERLE